MADNVALPASGVNAATDERSIGGSAVHVQRVSDIGASAEATGQASVTTTGAEKIAARETRKRVVIHSPATNTQDIYVGITGVSSANTVVLKPGGSCEKLVTSAIHAVAVSGTQTIQFWEEYDA